MDSSGNSVLTPWSRGILSGRAWVCLSKFWSCFFRDFRVLAWAGSLMRFLDSPGSSLRL